MGYTSKKVIFHLKLKFPTFCVGNSLQFFFPIRPSKSLQLGKFPTYRNTVKSLERFEVADFIEDSARCPPEKPANANTMKKISANKTTGNFQVDTGPHICTLYASSFAM